MSQYPPHSEISVTTHFHISIISKKTHKPPLFSAIPAVPSGQTLFSPPSQPLVLHFYQSTINSTLPTIQHTTNSAFNTFCSTVFWKHHPLCSKPKTGTNLEQRSREPDESLPGPEGYDNVSQQHSEHWASPPLSEVTTQSSAHRHGAEYYFKLQHRMHKIKTKFVPICNVMQRVLPDSDI
jgi:hypothetical protein